MEEIRISSNWPVDGENRLSNLVTCCSSDNKKSSIENVTAETCICLTKKEKECDSRPEVEIKCKFPIKEMNVLSEGKLLEVFGLHDEYLFTCPATFIDDWEGMAVYHAAVSLPNISRCKLKFTRVKEESRLWLYSIQLLVGQPDEGSNQMLLNINKVDKVIKEQKMCEKGEALRKLFETYVFHLKKSQNSENSITQVPSTVNWDCNTQDVKSLSHCLDVCNPTTPSGSFTLEKDNKTQLDCNLRSSLDRGISEMKEDIMRSLEVKLQEIKDETNAKLDRIINLLEALKT